MSQFYTPLLLPPALVRAQQEFSFALLREVAQATPQLTVFMSPLSVAAALLLVLEGSVGAAHAAIAAVLRVSDIPPEQVAAAVKRQLATLTQEGADQPILRIANSLWVNEQFNLNAEYAARVQQHYQAELAALDFASPAAAGRINAWVSQHTQGHIRNVVDAATLATQPPLVLANAVYFKGNWVTPFKEKNTRPGPFTRADGTQLSVPLMHLRSQRLGYQQGPGWQAVQLPYEGHPRRAVMQLFIPDQPTGLPDFLASLSAESWGQWQAAFGRYDGPVEVDLTMPRFRLEWGRSLTATLRALGLGPALTPGADFTPLGFEAGAPGFIGQLAHITYVQVDETGTEAAGLSMMMIGGAGGRPPEPRRVVVRADRPFFCAIVDAETDTILFCGAVYEPTWRE